MPHSAKALCVQIFVLVSFLLGNVWAEDAPSQTPQVRTAAKTLGDVIDRVIANENGLHEKLKTMHPLLETYIQEMKSDKDLESIPKTDVYFIGALNLSHGITEQSFVPAPGFAKRVMNVFAPFFSVQFFPDGFASMIMMDPNNFNRSHYKFEYVRREFLGDVRCLVLDVTPLPHAPKGSFMGRLWVEDQGYNVVRFDGRNIGPSIGQFYAHFDSWRVNSGPDLWLPACIYTEDVANTITGLKTVRFKGQTRLWGYQSVADRTTEAFANLTVESAGGVNDKSDAAADTAPVEAKRLWERQSEDNVLDRLEKAGLISPVGEVDKVLETVLNNLAVTNNINVTPGIRARVLLTTPLECLALGHTVVISRGLLDVLPDEASLAAVLAHELAHIVLGHALDTQFAFTDRLLFDDAATLKKLTFYRTPEEDKSAEVKALEILKNSPYKDKLPQIGLFLRMLTLRSTELPHLIHPLLGISIEKHGKVELSELVADAPELKVRAPEQISALPLGARIKVDPWSNQLRLMKTRNVPLLGPREKMPFEISPFILHLTRISQMEETAPRNGDASPGQTSKQAGPAQPPRQ